MISTMTVTSRTCLLSLLLRLEWVFWLFKHHWVVFLCLRFGDSWCSMESLALRPLLVSYCTGPAVQYQTRLSRRQPKECCLTPDQHGRCFNTNNVPATSPRVNKKLFRWQNCTVLLRVKCHTSLLTPSCLPAVKRRHKQGLLFVYH